MRSMKNVSVFTEDGAFALFFRPHPGEVDSSRVPTPGNMLSKAKKILMPRGQPGGCGGALKLTDALQWSCFICITFNYSYKWKPVGLNVFSWFHFIQLKPVCLAGGVSTGSVVVFWQQSHKKFGLKQLKVKLLKLKENIQHMTNLPATLRLDFFKPKLRNVFKVYFYTYTSFSVSGVW